MKNNKKINNTKKFNQDKMIICPNISSEKNSFSPLTFRFSLKVLLIFHFLFFIFDSNAQSLDDYLKIAQQNNSMLKIKTADVALSLEKINEVNTIDNTDISFGVFASTPETRVGAQVFKFGVDQKLPWFGELKAKKEVAKNVAEIKQFDVALADKELVYNVKAAYYTLYYQQASTHILKDNKQVLKIYEKMALAALTNNKATMSDVLKIRVQKNELHSKVFQNLNSISYLSKNFNKLLQRDENIPLNIADSLNVLDILVTNKLVDTHPLILKIKKLDAFYTAQNKLITSNSKPKLTVGVDYIMVKNRTDIAVSQNGKDIFMPKISLRIPLFNKKYNSQHKQLKIQQDILSEKIKQQKTTLNIALDDAKLRYENAVLSVVAAQKNKEETQRAINVDLKAYETGILDYDKILRLQIQKIKFELKEIEATKKAFIAKAKIKYLSN